jgi:hypothetical protein
MAVSSFIPAGRTSLVRKGNLALQVQTEYAIRPVPRITTTILKEGQVLHKIERVLDRVIESFEEQRSIESGMKRQHIEVVDILQSASLDAALNLTSHFTSDGKNDRSASIPEKLGKIPGVRKLYHLDYEGNFQGAETSDQFKKQFSFIFKNLREVLSLFAELPGGNGSRERGVYEVEQDRLYFVSLGTDCYFLLISPVHTVPNYEAAIRNVLNENSPAGTKF